MLANKNSATRTAAEREGYFIKSIWRARLMAEFNRR